MKRKAEAASTKDGAKKASTDAKKAGSAVDKKPATAKKPAPTTTGVKKPVAAAKKPAAAKTSQPKKVAQSPIKKAKTQLRGKGLKKKKVLLRFGIDCTHPVEDAILDINNFVSILSRATIFAVVNAL